MTVSARHTKNIYIGDGTTRNWPYTFSLNHEDHIRIVLESPDGKITQICSEYQVDLLEGYVRYPIENEPLARGWKIALLRKTPLVQEMDLVNNGGFFPETIESAFDRGVLVEQEFQEEIDRTVKVPETEVNPSEFVSELLGAKYAAQQAAGEAQGAQGQAERSAALSKEEADRSFQEAERSKESANQAEIFAEQASTGGVRSVNGMSGNVLLRAGDIGAISEVTGTGSATVACTETKVEIHVPEPNYPVSSINGKKGNVVLQPSDVGASDLNHTHDGVGDIGDIRFPAMTVKSCELKLDGSLVSRGNYSALWNWAERNQLVVSETDWSAGKSGLFGSGNGSTMFRLPDLRSEFLRVVDDGRGSDAGRTLGISQGDAIRNITGWWSGVTDPRYFSVGGAIINANRACGSYSSATLTANHGAKFDASYVVPTANENRPRNLAYFACIRFI